MQQIKIDSTVKNKIFLNKLHYNNTHNIIYYKYDLYIYLCIINKSDYILNSLQIALSSNKIFTLIYFKVHATLGEYDIELQMVFSHKITVTLYQ